MSAETKKYSIWTIGITDDPARRKREHGQEGKETKFWISWEADTEAIARKVEAYFVGKGMKGGVGGDTGGRFVYIF